MSSGTSSGHSLAFRVMRLCRPALQVDLGLRLDPVDLIFGEDDVQKIVEEGPDVEDAKAKTSFWRRSELQEPVDALGLSGLLVLPQTFGVLAKSSAQLKRHCPVLLNELGGSVLHRGLGPAIVAIVVLKDRSIYLGETFCSYISVGNHTNHDVRDVGVKAELQTERQKVVLADSTKSPLDYVRAGGRYDFIIEHDIKELGPHTLVCMAVYTDSDGERKYLPQYFKFMASNPLSVRTKVRVVKDITYLEACIENNTKSHLFLEYVKFDAAAPLVANVLEPDEDPKDDVDGLLRGLFNKVKLVRSNGGTRHFLYELKRPGEPGSSKSGISNALGKLEILWRTTLGEPGRLQTQQIMGNPTPRKDVTLELVEVPSRVILERAFLVRLCINNFTDRRVGPLQISMLQDDALAATKAIMVNGLWTLIVPQLEPWASTDVNLSLVAVAVGVQRIIGIRVVDARDGKAYDTIPPTEVFVEPF